MTSKSESIKLFLNENKSSYIKPDVTCGDLLRLQRDFYNKHFRFFRITETLVYDLIKHYYTSQGRVNNDGNQAHLLLNKKYKGALSYNGKVRNQELDISLADGSDHIYLGISIKLSSENSNSYFDGADFCNPLLIEDYRHISIPNEERFIRLIETKKKIYVDPILQDMARIRNLQVAQKSNFPSLTIVYDPSVSKDDYWKDEFSHKFNHRYIFLGDFENQSFMSILEDKLPLLKKLRQ